ncbi:MAG: oligosaccharide flippase family protein [Acidimicrobiales bacterium]
MNLRTLLDRLPVGTLVRRAATLGSGAAIGQIAVVGATPLLARMYEKSDFGVLSVVLAVTGVAIVVSSLRYEQAIVVAESDEEASAVAQTSAALVVVVVTLTSVLALAGGHALASFTNSEDLQHVLWLVPPTIAAGGINQILVSWATRRGDFEALSRSKAAQGIGMAATQLLSGWLFNGPIGLVAGITVGWIVGTIMLLPSAGDLHLTSLRLSWAAAVRYRRFPQLGLLASLLNRGALEIPAVALAALHGPEVAGAFLIANRVVATPTRLVTEAAYQVYVNEASRLQRETPGELGVLFNRSLRRLALLSIPPALLLSTIGPWSFGLVFGGDWSDAGDYVRLLSLVLVAMLVTQPVAATLWILDRQDLQLVREIARVVLVALAFVIAGWFDLTPTAAVFAYVIAMSAGYGLLLAMCRTVVHGVDSAPARPELAVA